MGMGMAGKRGSGWLLCCMYVLHAVFFGLGWAGLYRLMPSSSPLSSAKKKENEGGEMRRREERGANGGAGGEGRRQ